MTVRSITRRPSSLLSGLTALAVIAAALTSTPAGAETVDAAYRRGLKHHFAGQHKQAVEVFERLVALPTHHEDLFYNLGCAYFRLGRLGPAIYNFERSLALDPDREDARFNLRTARALVQRRAKDVIKGASDQPWWVTVVTSFGQLGWSVAFLGVWWLFFLLLLLLRRVAPGPLRAGLIAGSSLVALVSLLTGALLLGRIDHDRRVKLGVILPDSVAVREGTARTTKKLFALHAGLKVRLIGEDSGWVRIRLANGLEGWLPRSELGKL